MATLGTVSGTIPTASLGDLAPGASNSVTVIFPSLAGVPGAAVAEKFTGTYAGGTFGGSIRAKLP